MTSVKNPIKIDRENRKIIVNKNFLSRANYFGTAEYEKLESVRQAYPNFSVTARTISKNEEKESYKGLTYAYMEKYIDLYRADLKQEYQVIRLRAECHSIRYAHVKRWFLSACPEVNSFDIENCQVA